MKPEELVAKAKEMLNDGKLEDAKAFIEEHKEDIGDKIHDLTGLLGENAGDALHNAEGMLDKVKGLFGK